MTSSLSNDIIPNEDIPVLLTIFNRPDKTRAVIDNLRLIKPKKIFIAADGPSNSSPKDIDNCLLARQEATSVDWSCDIKTRFLDSNLGCDPAVASAIDWFFQNVDFGIILEDDCLLHPHFFSFCGDLFKRYSHDQRIMQISSISPYPDRNHPYDYHFSWDFRCHGGWGTWRRAWKHYTPEITHYTDYDAIELLKTTHIDYYEVFWKYNRLLESKKGRKCYWNHWDFQWDLACKAQNGLSIVPEKNLMVNIGFDEHSTHTVQMPSLFKNLNFQPLNFPLRHPHFIYADTRPEKSVKIKHFRSLPLKSRIMYLYRRLLGFKIYIREVLPF